MTGLVGVFLEAWGEVRVHRARVVLSLVGVLLAVFAMTAITAAGGMGRQALLESDERSGGRSTTLSVYAYSPTGSLDPDDVTRAYDAVVDRFGISWSSEVFQNSFPLGDPSLGAYANAYLVEPDYAVIHRITPAEGRWLDASDADRFSPALVVNRAFLDQTGTTGSSPPFAVDLPGEPGGPGVTATVVGVVDRDEYGPLLMALPEAAAVIAPSSFQGSTPGLEVWVPPGDAEQLITQIPAALRAQGLDGDAHPFGGDPAETLKMITYVQWAIRGVSIFALVLGALGVLNVGIVTVRQRVREIGVRRALGASSGRVFAAIVLESVVATALAAALGVALAVALVVNLPLERFVGSQGLEVPPFPVSAAVEAFVSATVIGALVGLVPATIAVRAKVIDAIRY